MDHNGTPRARPGLKFANRVYENSPLNPNKSQRFGTPQTAPSRKTINKPSASSEGIDAASISAARNIFRHSAISNNSSTTPFSPKLSSETKTKVFAPGATPTSQRVYREATAQATPRGMMAKSTTAELFTMRIPSPPPEQSGEMLAKRVPPEMEAKGTVYADQFLADLVPPEYDDLQRRQLFCILDLRRLKYSANEVFAKKDWKLNIMNFAKEFEKSRSLIMLRYGLYEFKNVKPSAEVLRKWRAAHGLPATEDDDVVAGATPTKQGGGSRSTKRKADDEAPSRDGAYSAASASKSKKRAFDREDAPAATPAPNKNKRKVSVSEQTDDSQPSKLQKSTPSATKSLFEQAYNNKPSASSSSPARDSPKPNEAESSKPQSNPFAAASATTVNGRSSGSVFDTAHPSQSTSTHNIFGALESAQTSGQDEDSDSGADDEAEADTQETGQQSDEPSVVASGGADTPTSQSAGGLFGSQRPLAPTAPSAGASRESTPGRSLFDRVTKGSDGQPVRAGSADGSQRDATDAASDEKKASASAAPVNATWNPDSPIKFGGAAASSSGGSLFAASTTSNATSLFGQKPAATSNASALFGAATQQQDKQQEKPEFGSAGSLFGAQKPTEQSASPAPAMFGQSQEQAKPAPASSSASLFGAHKQEPAAEQASSSAKAAGETEKSAESDKENNSQSQAKSTPFAGFAPKPTESSSASSLFQPKPSADAAAKPATPSFSFGATDTAASKTESDATPKPSTPSFSFGASKPEEPKASSAPSSNLFASQDKPKESSVLNSSTLFGASSKPAGTDTPATTETVKPLFGAGSTTTTPGSGLFGQANGEKPAAASTPFSSFGAMSNGAEATQAKPLFGSSGKTDAAAGSAGGIFGSQIRKDEKQDEPPAKKPFGGSNTEQSSGGFAFGSSQSNSTPSAGLFGAASSQPQPNGQASGGASFSFSGAGQSFNNPFASGSGGNDSNASPAPASGMFNFGGASTAPASGNAAAGLSPFQFGGSGPSSNGTSSSPFQFGGTSSAPSQPPAPTGSSTFSFGAGSQTQPPSMNFTSASPQPSNQNDNIFAPKPNPPGGSMFNLQPPGQGASTTGTNSPFNFGGASSLATTPATGTPEPTADGEKTSTSAPSADQGAPGHAEGGDDDDSKPHEQIVLTEGGPGEEDETVIHEVRSKVLKFVKEEGDDKSESKSPWKTQGVGPFRLLKHKNTGAVRMLVRAEPRGNVVLNRGLLPGVEYTANGKYVKMMTSNDSGSGIETWMVQVKTPDMAKELAKVLEENKSGGEGEK